MESGACATYYPTKEMKHTKNANVSAWYSKAKPNFAFLRSIGIQLIVSCRL